MTITRLADTGQSAGSINAVEITNITSSTRFVTSVVTSLGKLKLISWDFANNSIVRMGDSGNDEPQTTTHVAAPRYSSFDLSVLHRANNDAVVFQKWSVHGGTGPISKVKEMMIGGKPPLGASFSGSGIVTAVRDMTTQKLKLRNLSDATVNFGSVLGAAATGGAVDDFAMPAMSDLLITAAIRGDSQRLKLIAWEIDHSGSINRVADSGNDGPVVSRVSCTTSADVSATAVRDSNGKLRVTFWERQGATLKQVADSGPNGISISDVKIEMLLVPEVLVDLYRVVTAVRTITGTLRMLTFEWNPNTPTVQLIEQSPDQPESIGLVQMAHLGNNLFVTAVRDDTTSSKHLKLILWSIY